MSKRAASEEDRLQSIKKPKQESSSTPVRLSCNYSITPWKLSEVSPDLPPLPKILDAKLEQQVFRHPGIGGGPSYERLEWVGDAWLEMVSTNLIDLTFPHLPAGKCSQIREQCVRNITLSAYFREYNLPAKAQLPPVFGDPNRPLRGRSADKDLLKTQADMFEAYVAAIIKSDPEDGHQRSIDWLKALWARSIKDQLPREAGAETEGAMLTADGNKTKLSQRIQVTGIKIEYKDLPCKKTDKHLDQPLYCVGVYLTGWGETNKLLGHGTDMSKKAAGNRAAGQVLLNKKMLRVYETKKEDFMKARAAAQERNEQA